MLGNLHAAFAGQLRDLKPRGVFPKLHNKGFELGDLLTLLRALLAWPRPFLLQLRDASVLSLVRSEVGLLSRSDRGVEEKWCPRCPA